MNFKAAAKLRDALSHTSESHPLSSDVLDSDDGGERSDFCGPRPNADDPRSGQL
jgi:hypothetical protein